jgi:hypothetical protein
LTSFFSLPPKEEKLKNHECNNKHHFFFPIIFFTVTTIMMRFFISTLLLLLSSIDFSVIALAFAPPPRRQSNIVAAVLRRTQSLRPLYYLENIETEEDAKYVMAKARDCAFSDSCGVQEAQVYLHQVLHVQSGCVTGTLSGHDLCDNQMEAAGIVAHLREKVAHPTTNTAWASTIPM